MKILPCLRLMRFDKPVGIALLWWPIAWALWLSANGHPPWQRVCLFFLGTVCMRAAGCVINDIADRNLDRHVKRTQNRPLTSGQVSLPAAFMCLGLLLSIALFILLQLPPVCFYYALAAVGLTVGYPFFKRFFPTPQAILALAFSIGIPMVYAAANAPLSREGWLLMGINVCWVLAYDTMYACVDAVDDAALNIHSTARTWGAWTRVVITGLLVLIQALWLVLATPLTGWFGLCWSIASGLIVKQLYLLYQPDPAGWFRAFRLSQWYGCLLWIGILP